MLEERTILSIRSKKTDQNRSFCWVLDRFSEPNFFDFYENLFVERQMFAYMTSKPHGQQCSTVSINHGLFCLYGTLQCCLVGTKSWIRQGDQFPGHMQKTGSKSAIFHTFLAVFLKNFDVYLEQNKCLQVLAMILDKSTTNTFSQTSRKIEKIGFNKTVQNPAK